MSHPRDAATASPTSHRQEPAPRGHETGMQAPLHDASYFPARISSQVGRDSSPDQQPQLDASGGMGEDEVCLLRLQLASEPRDGIVGLLRRRRTAFRAHPGQ